MKNVKIQLFGALLLGSIVLTSCEREGCTDEAAINYNKKAKKDNGTCDYKDESENSIQQSQNDHHYSLITDSGDTLFAASVPYSDGHAKTELDESNQYSLVFELNDYNVNEIVCGGRFLINQNVSLVQSFVAPQAQIVNSQIALGYINNSNSSLSLWSSHGEFEFQNVEVHPIPGGDQYNERVTLTINFDGVFVDSLMDQTNATFSITFNN